MVTKLQDAKITIEIDEGRALAELQKFRETLSQQGQMATREREGEQKKEEVKAKGAIKKEQKGAIAGLSAMGQRITGAINSIKRATLEGAIALPLTLILGAAAAPAARAAVRAAELGPEIGTGLLKSELGEITKGIPGADAAIETILAGMGKLSDEITKTNAAVQAIGQTIDQVGKVGISLGGAGQGALVVDAKFASRLTQGMYDFNKAQIGARRFAYKEGIKNISESIGSVMGNVFNE